MTVRLLYRSLVSVQPKRVSNWGVPLDQSDTQANTYPDMQSSGAIITYMSCFSFLRVELSGFKAASRVQVEPVRERERVD